jgi:hypothetical protein
MRDVETFAAEVNAKIKQLNAADAPTRRLAAEWLGEAGEPTAITALVQAYKNDADPAVRQAAAYSLGMFRKLEETLNGPDAAKVDKLIEDIVFKGKMGRKARIPRKGLLKLVLGLLLSALLTGALALILPGFFPASGGAASNQVAPGGERDRAGLLTDLRGVATRLGNAVTALRTQYQGVLGGREMDCAQPFESFSPVALSAGESASLTDLGGLVQQTNDAIAAFTQAKAAAFDPVCTGGETRAAGDYGPLMVSLNTLTANLTTLNDGLTAAGG